MDAFDAYKIYIALKSHFTRANYDYFKYNKKTNVKMETFLKRKDRYYFSKIGRKYGESTENYFLSNFLYTPKGWIGDFNDENYNEWVKTSQSRSYVFKTDIGTLMLQVKNFDELFTCNSGKHPVLLKNYLAKRISLDTLVILDQVLGYVRRFDKQMKDDVIWPEVGLLIRKYSPFITVDTKRYKHDLLTLVEDYGNGS